MSSLLPYLDIQIAKQKNLWIQISTRLRLLAETKVYWNILLYPSAPNILLGKVFKTTRGKPTTQKHLLQKGAVSTRVTRDVWLKFSPVSTGAEEIPSRNPTHTAFSRKLFQWLVKKLFEKIVFKGKFLNQGQKLIIMGI